MELPTLENKIKEIAEQKIEEDIYKLHNAVYGDDESTKFFNLLKGVEIKIALPEINGSPVIKTVCLSTIFDDKAIKFLIKQVRLPEYIEKEINLIVQHRG